MSIYSEDPISGTLSQWESYVIGTVSMEPKFTIPYNLQFISGILM